LRLYVHRIRKEIVAAGIEECDAHPRSGGIPARWSGLSCWSKSWKRFSLNRTAPGVCDRSLQRTRHRGPYAPEGGRSLPVALLQSCPALSLLPVLPSLREGARNVFLPIRADGRGYCFKNSASVHEAPHADVHHHPQRKKHEQNRRPSVTH